jgi:hypothetical protein
MNQRVLAVFGDDDFGRAAGQLESQTRAPGGHFDKSRLHEPYKVLHQAA